MKLFEPITAATINQLVKGNLVGNPDTLFYGLNEIHKVAKGDLTFVDYHKYYSRAVLSGASVILINEFVDFSEDQCLIVSTDPFRDFKIITQWLVDSFLPTGNNVFIDSSSEIGQFSTIMHNAYIGPNVTIGKNCWIGPNVAIYRDAIIGNNVTIHANTTIGNDAFYYKKRGVVYDKLITIGRVIIEDNVDIGAGCTIASGATGDTKIGKGTKIDNQCHIGHGAIIGKNCFLSHQVGVGGKSIIEDEVTLWSQVNVQKDLKIDKAAVVLSQSSVNKSLKGFKVYFGNPAIDAKVKYKEIFMVKQLPNLYEHAGYSFEQKEDEMSI